MSIVFVLLPVSVVLAAVAVAGFVWSVRRGQLDDLVTPALRMLDDDEPSHGRGSREKGAW